MNYEKIMRQCWKELEDKLLEYAEYDKLMVNFKKSFCKDMYYIYLDQEYKQIYGEEDGKIKNLYN